MPVRFLVPALSLIVLSLAAPSHADEGDSWPGVFDRVSHSWTVVPLPFSFDVQPGNRLYVYCDTVRYASLTLVKGDSLRLNGVAIWPRRPAPPEPDWPDEKYAEVYGDIPLVTDLIRNGVSPRAAAKRFEAAYQELARRSLDAYREDIARTGDTPEVRAAAARRVRDLDTLQLIDWDCTFGAAGGVITHGVKGTGCNQLWGAFEGRGGRSPRSITDEDKQRIATSLYRRVGLAGPPLWYFLDYGGETSFGGYEMTARAQSQIDRARRGEDPGETPISSYIARCIVAKEAEHRVESRAAGAREN